MMPPNLLVAFEEGNFQEPGSIWLGDLGACTYVGEAGLLEMMSPW